MSLYPARRINTRRIDFKPSLGGLTTQECRPADICHLLNRLFRSQAMRDFNNGALGVTVQQQIAFTVDHN